MVVCQIIAAVITASAPKTVPVAAAYVDTPDKVREQTEEECRADLPAAYCAAGLAYTPKGVVRSFAIDAHEVSVKAYRRCAASGHCSAIPLLVAPKGAFASPDLPMTWLTRDEAATYCRTIGGALPSVLHWHAAFAGKDYPWGNTSNPSRYNHGVVHDTIVGADPSDGFTLAHTSSALRTDATALGIYHLAGNVSEWTSSSLSSLSSASPTSGSAAFGGAAIVKGGSYLLPEFFAHRLMSRPVDADTRAGDIGFRCVYTR